MSPVKSSTVRSTIITVTLLALVMRAPHLALLVLIGWGITEWHSFTRRFGNKGNALFVALVCLVVSLFAWQVGVYYRNIALISRIERLGASSAAMSGRLLPGPINYIALGPDAGDVQLAEMLRLAGPENLEFVVATRSRITDAGLMSLQQCHRLQHVFVGQTQVTPEGIAELRRVMPRCAIVFEPDG
jgi:hypothetical protein